MAPTLSPLTHGYAVAKAAVSAGRSAEARRLCSALLATPNLPSLLAAKIHRLAATVELGEGRYAVARCHLRAAARFAPKHAATRYRLGLAFETDPFGSDALAAKHYRAAAKLDQGNASYRAAFGQAAVRAGNARAGVKALARAAKLAPTDTAVLAAVIDGLLCAGYGKLAMKYATRARFLIRNDQAVLELWNRVRFSAARTKQEVSRPAVVLPFVRVVRTATATAGEGGIVRADAASRPRPHLMRLIRRVNRR